MAEELKDVEPLRSLLKCRRLGVFSDIDGTLAPIVPNPQEARVSPRCREVLGQLMVEGVRVALITGRAPAMARQMAGHLDGVVYAANHGMSIWMGGRDETSEQVREYILLAQRILDEVAGILAPGVFVEATGPNLAFHYRRATDKETARQAILAAIIASPSSGSFRVREGRKVIELLPPLDIDKGTALSDLVPRLGVQSLLCLGDDQTDIDMFRAVERLRSGGLPGAAVAVDSEEATPELLASADYFVRGVPGVEWLLTEILRTLLDQGT